MKFGACHFPHEDSITSDEIQNVRGFGAPPRIETLMDVVNHKLTEMRRKHDITLEHKRATALCGNILDNDNSTSILNLYTAFSVSQPAMYFDWAGGSYNIVELCNQLWRWMEDKLQGDKFSYIHALCAPDFFDAMLASTQVQAAYKLFTTLQPLNIIRDNLTSQVGKPKTFPFQGILWEEYRAYATLEAGDGSTTTEQFIAAGTCRFAPMGTKSTFMTHYAPGTFIDVANEEALRFYARMAPDKYNRRVDLYSESNPLPYCNKPLVLVQGNKGTGAGTTNLT